MTFLIGLYDMNKTSRKREDILNEYHCIESVWMLYIFILVEQESCQSLSNLEQRGFLESVGSSKRSELFSRRRP